MYIFDITVIQSRLHNIKGHTLQERTGFPLEAFTLGKTSRHKHKSHTFFSSDYQVFRIGARLDFFHNQLCFNDLTVSISTLGDWVPLCSHTASK